MLNSDTLLLQKSVQLLSSGFAWPLPRVSLSCVLSSTLGLDIDYSVWTLNTGSEKQTSDFRTQLAFSTVSVTDISDYVPHSALMMAP